MITFIKTLLARQRVLEVENNKFIAQILKNAAWAGLDKELQPWYSWRCQGDNCVTTFDEANYRLYQYSELKRTLKKKRIHLKEPTEWTILKSSSRKSK